MIGQKTKDKMYVEGMNIMGNFLKTNFKEKANSSPEILSIATKDNSIKECLACTRTNSEYTKALTLKMERKSTKAKKNLSTLVKVYSLSYKEIL